MAEGALWLWNRLRPAEGWLPLVLLLGVIVVINGAVLSVGWVPEDRVVVPATLLGLLLGMALARRAQQPWLAWTLISVYGLLIVGGTLARMWPPPSLWGSDLAGLRDYWLENGGRFVERSGAWVTAVVVGSRSNETIVFALLLGLLGWFLAAYVGWCAFRARRPLPALALLGLLVALNGYFGGAEREWAAMFAGLAALTTAVFHYARMAFDWEERGVDYVTQIRLEITGYAGGIALALLALAFLLPTLRVSTLARLVLDNEQALALEERLESAFGGVETRREALPAPGGPGGSGVLPRSFLLGSGPELERFIMMTATAQVESGPEGATAAWARNWRGLSYAAYTGRGWALAAGQEERSFVAGAAVDLPPARETMTLRQAVHWRYDNRATRYSLGLPLRIDQASTAVYGIGDDLVRLVGRGPVRYVVTSQHSVADVETLRAAQIEDVPPAILQRYTNLPASVPRRVGDLARQVTAGAATPYDQALALESFLRQYPYSLDLPVPPAEVDVVDYFLFDLQRGYCDYYATALAVMARGLGLPARVATGYAARPPDAEGVQTIRQSDAHTWPEVYFAGLGWVAFEPTAALSSAHAAGAFAGQDSAPELPQADAPPPLPPQDAARRGFPWPLLLGGLALAAAGGWLLWRWVRRPRPHGDGVQVAYARLQAGAGRLGIALPSSQTPAEFTAALQERLARVGGGTRRGRWAAQVEAAGGRLAALFARRQYGGKDGETGREAAMLWARARRPLWGLWLAELFRREEAKDGQDDGLA